MKTSVYPRRLLLIIGGLVVLAAFFFGTLLLLDFMDRRSRDALRVETAKSLMAALEKYRASKGAYPVLKTSDSYIPELGGPLVGGGYLRETPSDPPGSKPSHYVSFDGKAYGLLINLEQSGTCIVEMGASKTGWWGQPPPCSF